MFRERYLRMVTCVSDLEHPDEIKCYVYDGQHFTQGMKKVEQPGKFQPVVELQSKFPQLPLLPLFTSLSELVWL